jgi:hypothetical protein
VENEPAGPAVADSAILAAGVDQQLRTVAWLDPSLDPVSGVVSKVGETGEIVPLLRLDRRLGVRAEQLVTAAPELGDGIRSTRPVQVADPAPPIDEVEERLRFSARRLLPVPSG